MRRPRRRRTVAVGTATLTFQSCSAATLAYTFTGGSSAGAAGTDHAAPRRTRAARVRDVIAMTMARNESNASIRLQR